LNYRLWIAGEGPLFKEIKKRAPASAEFLGWLSHEEILERLNRAAFFIFPSEWYEGFGLSLLEAMALGKAIIASDLGPRKELIEDGISGLLFEAGNAKDLRAKVETLIRDASLRVRLGQTARETYLKRFTPETNYKILINIYNRLVK